MFFIAKIDTHVYCVFLASNLVNLPSIYQNKRSGGKMRCLFSCCAAAFGGNMRFLLRRRLSRTDRCQSDGKSKKRATWMGYESPLLARLSARCRLSFVFIWSGFYCSYSYASSSPRTRFSLSFARPRNHVGCTNGQEVR